MAHQQSQLNTNTTPPPYSGDASSAQLRSGIEQTRGRMDHTLDALGERLHPRHLLDDVISYFRGSGTASSAGHTASDAGNAVLGAVKDHPLPTALIGAGIAWLVYEQVRGPGTVRGYSRSGEPPMYSGSYVDARTGRPYDTSTYGEGARSPGGSDEPATTDKARDMAGRAGDKARDLAGRAGDGARDMASRAGDKASAAWQSVKGATEGAAEQVGEWSQSVAGGVNQGYEHARYYGRRVGSQVYRGYENTRDTLAQTMDDYPLATGAAAAAIGVIAGLLVPGTRREDRLMGEASDEIKDRASDLGRDAVEKAKDVAQSAADTASEEAGRQGLKPGQLAEKAQRVLSDVGRAAKESAEREGLSPDQIGDKAKQVAERTRDTARDETKDHAQDLNKKV